MIAVAAGASALGLTLLGVAPAMATDERTGSRNCGGSAVLGLTSYLGSGSGESHTYWPLPSGLNWGKGFVGTGTHFSVSSFHNADWRTGTDGTYSSNTLTGCY